MIAKGLCAALRQVAEQLITTANDLDRLGKMWDTSSTPNGAPGLVKKVRAIRKDMAKKKKKKAVRRKPHWTQTPAGKLKIATMNAKRWAKKEGNDQATTSSTPS